MNDEVITRMDRPDPSLCPARVRASIDAYCELGMPPGDFVRSVLANDLCDAVTRADDINLPALPHIVAYVIDRVPVGICGTREKVNAHVAAKAPTRRAATEPYGPSETQMRARAASLLPNDEAER